MIPAQLASAEAFDAWARARLHGVHVAELRPDGRGVVVTHAGHGTPTAGRYCAGYVVTRPGDGPADLHTHYPGAPCPGGIVFAYMHDGAALVGFERTADANGAEQARREAHALADWLAAESEAR